jgi:hypothetical protein
MNTESDKVICGTCKGSGQLPPQSERFKELIDHIFATTNWNCARCNRFGHLYDFHIFSATIHVCRWCIEASGPTWKQAKEAMRKTLVRERVQAIKRMTIRRWWRGLARNSETN